MEWTELLFFVKHRLGATTSNPLELSDAELVDIFKRIVLPELSTHLPDRIYVDTGSEDLILSGDKPDHEGFPFVFKLSTDRKIISVNDIYFDETISDYDDTYLESKSAMSKPEELGQLYDQIELRHYATATFTAPFTWELLPNSNLLIRVPETQRVDFARTRFITKLLVEHLTFQTVPRDQLTNARDLALSEIMISIGNIRSKFSGLNSQFGQIDLNGDRLKQEGEALRTDVLRSFENNPPEQVMYFFR